MSLIAIGTNHKYSPIELRERLYFSRKHLKEVLANLLNYHDIDGAVILSTCNRIEIYATASDAQQGMAALKAFLSDYHGQALADIESRLYAYIGKEAARHLFSVTTGLDSQILGEGQISEQVESAYREAKAFEATDKLLDAVFARTIEASVRMRAQISISKDKFSIADIVMDLVKTRHGSISDKKILIIGVGKISQLVIERLKEEGAKAVFISSRTYEKARELAGHIGAEVVGFDRLKERLKDADIVVSATSSPHLVITKETLEEAFSFQLSAFSRRLLIIDLALPRDIDPKVREVRGIELFNLDDLGAVIERATLDRKAEVEKAAIIIDREVDRLWERLIGSERDEVLSP